MIEIWKKMLIDDYIVNLKDYFLDCSKEQFRSSNTVESLNIEEKIYLNENLHLDQIVGAEKKCILNKVLQDKTKLNFARHILTSLSIELEVNNIDETKKSVFELIIENAFAKGQYFYYNQLLYLYRRGYINTKSDEKFLIDFYKTKISSQQILELWFLARICFKLKNHEKIEKAFEKMNIILAIISFKQGKPIGFNYPNLLGVANNAIQFYREHGDLMLYAMKYYKVYDEIKNRDKKGTFKLKEEDYAKYKPVQDIEFNEIAFEIFPELRH